MHEGRIVGHIADVKKTSENELGLYMLGVKKIPKSRSEVPAVNKKFTIVRLLCAFGIAIALSVAVIFAVSEEPVTAIYNLFWDRCSRNVTF